jgi:lipopolysaccharide/colanic/teichoic acid biosynthesis glycosyltransferase
MERAQERPPGVVGAVERLQGSRARFRLAAKRGFDLMLALAMLAALLPVLALACVLLLGDDDGWIERRARLGRDGRLLWLWRFRPLPGALGCALERLGVRELPLLLSVVGGGLSFVGPRARQPGDDVAPPPAMAPGLTGPAQRWATDPETASELDEAYVQEWSLRRDLRLLAGSRRSRPLAVRR